MGDLDADCGVDWDDLRLFTEQWLDNPGGSANLDGEPGVNMGDFVMLADNWLEDYGISITLLINEFMASNSSFIQDPCGNYDDWIEIYNYGDTSINTAGMYLTDDVYNPTKWQIPSGNPSATTVAAGGYLLFWADAQTFQGPLHTSFKLSAGGEDVALFYTDGSTGIDSITNFPPQDADNSYGRFPNGGGTWQVFIHDTNTPPTPGGSNGGETIGKQVLISEIMYHSYHDTNALEPENIAEEYIELFNGSGYNVNLSGWRFTDGVDFTFPNVTLAAGQYLVVAADVNTFSAKYPGVTNVVGGWVGRLSNSGEEIELINAEGVRIDWLCYADEGDWSVRERGPLDNNHYGWVWSDAHDGGGKSLELINRAISNDYGQNWAVSLVSGGTPGAKNSVDAKNIAPLILDVSHSPTIPHSTDIVAITANILDELTTGITARLYYRVDVNYGQTPNTFSTLTMFDDGAHGDGRANDGIYGAQMPAYPNNKIIEFYIKATDSNSNNRTWPAPTQPSGQQLANLLYQVDNSFDPDAEWVPGSQPIYHIIMTDAERYELLVQIGNGGTDKYSNAQMNTTFISVDGTDIKTRYNCGVRNRGKGSRLGPPMNYRVNFPHDRPWMDVTAININSRVSHSQLIGSAINRLAGIVAAEATAVQTRVNGLNRIGSADPYFGTYAHDEVMDSDFADKHFPADDAGNVYRVIDPDKQADLTYLGTDPASYIARGYEKATNKAENNWSDLINLTNVLTNTANATYVKEVKKVVNIEQWLRWLAVQCLFSNTETNLGNGYGDDYYLYCGIADPRFILIPYDLDNILGLYDIPDQYSDPGVYNASIWCGKATDTSSNIDNVPRIERFLRHPSFVGRYYAYLKDEIKTTFSPEKINPLLDQALSGYVPQSTINNVKQFIADRNAYVLTKIPPLFSISSDLSISKGYYKTTSATLATLKAAFTDNTTEPLSVRVNGQLADWARVSDKWWPSETDPRWTISTNITLKPGINRVIVQTFDDPNGTGNEVERGDIDIWYSTSGSTVPNPLTAPNTVLNAASGPWYVSNSLTIPADKTLTIQAGTTVFFSKLTSLTVNGRLVAEGTEYQHIRLAPDPDDYKPPNNRPHWNGISFINSSQDNRLCYVDMELADNGSQAIYVNNSKLLIDNMTWLNTTNLILEVSHPSLIVQNSVFPNTSGVEIIHGSSLSGSEYFILRGNTFGTTTGYNDIIDFSGCARPGPILQVYDNIFRGGQDDGLDLDGTDAHVEGNLFMNFKGGVTSTSNAIATDLSSEVTAVRNIFLGNDRAVLLKGGAFLKAEHNVFAANIFSSINFQEDAVTLPGEGACLVGNIFWDNNSLFENKFGADPNIIVNQCIIPAQFHFLGVGNIDADPLFVDADANDFHLKSISPAIGAGINGLDIGAYVPSGASVSGEPNGLTHKTSVNLTVDGPGITHYKYRLNNGSWSSERSVDTPIGLTGLVNGNSYTVYTIGKNSAGVWQDANYANASNTWTIDTSYSQLVINEVLAQNIEAVNLNGTSPDLIELYYDGPAPRSLYDMSISDNPDNPRKFVFPPGAAISPGQYLVLYADDNFSLPGFHLGFKLEADGEGVYLYDTAANGSSLIDSVTFGIQLGDLSIGRVASSQWRLTIPTLGQANIAHTLGNPAALKVNEWLADEDVLQDNDLIEIYNPQPMPVDMGRMYLTDDPAAQPNRHQLSPLTFVDGAGYAVFIADGDPGDGADHLNFRLSPHQEIIGLFDTDISEVDTVIYYPQTTDISQGRAPDGNNIYEFFEPPTPFVSNITTIVINEVLAHSHSGAPDWIELYNTTDSSIDIGGWFLSDSSANKTKYGIADGTTIAANSFLVFYENADFNDPCDPNCIVPFALSENGEMVCLSSADNNVMSGYYKKQEFGASPTGVSFGRYLKSTGIYDFVAMDSNTPGSANAYPKVGPVVISEIMYHPEPNVDAEYIELYNITGNKVNLFDVEGNPWKFTDGIDFTFPTDVNIPAHAYLLVVADMTAFTAEYTSVPPGVQIFQWQSGRLANEGEQIALSMPGDVDAAGQRYYICIDNVRYDDNPPWPITPDGCGKSLTRIDLNDYGNDPLNWDANNPSPGQ